MASCAKTDLKVQNEKEMSGMTRMIRKDIKQENNGIKNEVMAIRMASNCIILPLLLLNEELILITLQNPFPVSCETTVLG